MKGTSWGRGLIKYGYAKDMYVWNMNFIRHCCLIAVVGGWKGSYVHKYCLFGEQTKDYQLLASVLEFALP